MASVIHNRSLSDYFLTAAMLVSTVFFGYAAYNRWVVSTPAAVEAPAPMPQEPLALDGAVQHGSKAAPLALLVYTDFACSACGEFAVNTIPALLTTYVDTGRLLLAFRFISNGTTRPMAYRLAEAAACADDQNGFWPMHDSLFRQGGVLSEDGIAFPILDAMLIDIATKRSLNSAQFKTCLQGETRDRIFRDAGSGLLLGVKATPTLFLGRLRDGRFIDVVKREQGALTIEALRIVLDQLYGSSATDVSGNVS